MSIIDLEINCPACGEVGQYDADAVVDCINTGRKRLTCDACKRTFKVIRKLPDRSPEQPLAPDKGGEAAAGGACTCAPDAIGHSYDCPAGGNPLYNQPRR